MMSNAEFRIPGTRETRALLQALGHLERSGFSRGSREFCQPDIIAGPRAGVMPPCWAHGCSSMSDDEKSFPLSFSIVLSQKLSLGWELIHPTSLSSPHPWPCCEKEVGQGQLKSSEFPFVVVWLPEKKLSWEWEGRHAISPGDWGSHGQGFGRSLANQARNPGKLSLGGRWRRLDRSTQIIESNHCHAHQSTFSSLEKTFWTLPRRVIPVLDHPSRGWIFPDIQSTNKLHPKSCWEQCRDESLQTLLLRLFDPSAPP